MELKGELIWNFHVEPIAFLRVCEEDIEERAECVKKCEPTDM
jgi:hypothetical protein